MTIEKRKYKRVYLRFPVECRGKNIWQKAEASNVSEGGMFVVTDKVEEVGTPLEVIFNFGKKDKKLIHADGVVVWVREKEIVDSEGRHFPVGMGIRFIHFSPLDTREFMAKEIEEWENEA